MGEPKNRWTWDLPGFEPRKPDEGGEDRGYRPAVRRLSVSQSSLAPRADQPKRPVAVRLQKLKNQLKVRAPCVSRPPLLPFDLSGPFMCSSFSFSVVGWRNRSEDEEEEELEEDAYCSDYSSFVTSCMGCKRRERKQNMAQKLKQSQLLETRVYGKAPYRPVHTGPAADRYVDRPLSGDTTKIGRRRSISAVDDRFRPLAVD
ncbi:hypothetical protein B296_00051930 [Ensete ventricosum]|uniref:Uncharacterized protein n=1 Tax=Ensete ventricosum TaxID=4639 RepID=A0A426YEK6_ENSVE|nr:hypothetical protein B296_00051930 [Ensete ventricosum]